MDKKDPFVLRHLADVQPDLWWLDSDPMEPAPHSALIGDIGADLCVVGAGYTGLWTALLAKERDPDREVVVVEQFETGAGASGRNGGFCSASLTHGYLNGVRRFPDEIELIQRLGRENLDEIEATIRRYNIECDFERTGELQVAVAPWQFRGMAEQAERRNAMGDTVEVLSQDEVQARVHSPSYVGALFDHDGTALVDPARLVWGLEKVCIALGVKIFENSKVEWLEDLHDAVRVHTPYGAVTAARVALGTNVFPSLLRKTRKYVVPVYDYVMVTEPLSAAQLESVGWSHREGIADGDQRRDFIYVDDAVRVMMWLMATPSVSGIFNVGTGKARSFKDMMLAAYAALGTVPNIRYVDMPEAIRDSYQYFTQSDGDRLRRAGYNGGFTALEEAVESYVKGFLDRADRFR